jgi:hypothetical protein
MSVRSDILVVTVLSRQECLSYNRGWKPLLLPKAVL